MKILQLLIIFPLSFYQFSHTLFGAPLYFSAKPYTIWRNCRFLPNCIGFCQIVSLLPNRMRFCQKVSLKPNRLYFLAKYPPPEQKFTHSQMYKCLLKHKKIMYLSDLCSGRNAIFTGFLRFPQLYPPETKTLLGAKVIAPSFAILFTTTLTVL